MKRPIPILTALLAVQIILAVVLFSTGRETGAFVSDKKLVGLDLTEIDGLRIEEAGQPMLTVKKQGESWSLPDHYDFPASTDKVNDVAGKLFGLTQTWPVATTVDAAKHFKVADSEFERKISFLKGDQVLKTILLGTSPGFKKVHARVSGEDPIYSIEFSTYEASVKADDWTDKEFLKLKESDVVRAELPSFALVRGDNGLTVENLTETEETDTEQATELVRRLSGLNFQSVLGKEDKPEYKLDAPVFQFTLHTKAGDSVRYTFGKPDDKEDLVLKTSAHPYYVTVSKYTVESLEDFSRDKMVRTREAQKAPADTTGTPDNKTTEPQESEAPAG